MSSFPDVDYSARIAAAQSLMGESGLDGLLLSVGADLPYLTGYEAMPLERLTMLVLQSQREPVLLVPELEAPRVRVRDEFAVRSWGELEDPIRIVADLVPDGGRFGIGDTTWSTFLLQLQEALPAASFEPASRFTSRLRIRKTPDEVSLLRAAAEAADRVMGRLEQVTWAGRSELDIAREITAMTVDEGHDTAIFWIVASGPNAASPHHEPADRVIREGDTIVVDFGGRRLGYCSDTTRTFFVGEPPAEVAEAYEVLLEAQTAARAAVAPGVSAASIDRAARSVIEDAGFGDRFIHRTGHGIGLEAHEQPYIVGDSELEIEEGMVFSIEPGIYTQGEWGMRIEDIVACGAEGVDELNRSARHLRLVG